MFEGGSVRVGKNRILYGPPLSGDFDFKYSVEKVGGKLWLILESKAMRFELVKLCDEVGNLRESFVKAPIKDYPPDRMLELERHYKEMRRKALGQDSSTSTNRMSRKGVIKGSEQSNDSADKRGVFQQRFWVRGRRW